MGVMFKKQADFVRQHLDAIEEFLGPDDPNVLMLRFDDNNAIRDHQNGTISLIIENETYNIDRKEIDSFVHVENVLASLTDEELRMVTAKGMDNGLQMGILNFKTTMDPEPALIVHTPLTKHTFTCDGNVIIDQKTIKRR